MGFSSGSRCNPDDISDLTGTGVKLGLSPLVEPGVNSGFTHRHDIRPRKPFWSLFGQPGIGEGGGDEEDVRLVVRTMPSRGSKSESPSDGTFAVPGGAKPEIETFT
jgi:hypothetical protein